MRIRRALPAALAMVFLAGLAPLGAQPRIHRGIDAFVTAADGRTHSDFAQHPIPAGFFCDRSEAFTGKVALKGLPLATAVPGQLWGADTIVERLDDAVFDAKGAASTRIRFRALSLVSIEPIKTACGAFHVYVSLAGPQRTTQMNLSKAQENGGIFNAPLAVDARLTFIPVKAPVKVTAGTAGARGGQPLAMTASFTFPAKPIPWSFNSSGHAKKISSAVVDTDGDLKPETLLPGASNFAPGVSPVQGYYEGGGCPCWEETCHDYDGEQHCYYPTLPPNCPMIECGN